MDSKEHGPLRSTAPSIYIITIYAKKKIKHKNQARLNRIKKTNHQVKLKYHKKEDKLI